MFSSTGFSFGLLGTSTRVNSEPHFAEKFKAIRDKKERFLCREKWGDEAGFYWQSPARNRQLVGRGREAVTESMVSPSPKETPGKTPVFQVGESSHGPRYSIRDRAGSLPRTSSNCTAG
jgi:hypothetical protein